MSEPKSIWSYQDNFDFSRDIGPSHPFHFPLERHRGEYSRRKMLAQFGLDAMGQLHRGIVAKTNEAVLFGGHIGCGKSTELRDFAELFGRSHAYTVNRIEITKILDINNLRFSDLLIALAHELMQTLNGSDLSLHPDAIYVDPVVNWFESRIRKREQFTDLEGEVKTQAKASAGIPWLVEFLATITTKVRSGASYREELRTEIRNGFTQLLGHFNALIAHANDLLRKEGRGPLLFIIDGTDKLKREDSETFFNSDIHQLVQIASNLVVCAPISVLLEFAQVGQRFQRIQLPMVKIVEANSDPRRDEEDALIELVTKRMPIDCFDNRETVRYLVQHSGGHVRDLLRLVRTCFSYLDAEVISKNVAEQAVRSLASEYQRLVRKDDWTELVKIDISMGDEKDRTEDRMRLLYELVLLEYNSYWWRSHPLVRTLPAYKKALTAAQSAPSV